MINAKETTEDMYSSIDLAAARIERQVRKWKDKIRDHKPHGGPSTSVREMVITPEEVEPPGSAASHESPKAPVAPKRRPRPASTSSRTNGSPRAR